MAFYPSEGSLVKMLYRASFKMVYRMIPLPDHDDFRETAEHARRRTVLLASIAPIDMAGVLRISPPHQGGETLAKEPPAHPPHSPPNVCVPLRATPRRQNHPTN